MLPETKQKLKVVILYRTGGIIRPLPNIFYDFSYIAG